MAFTACTKTEGTCPRGYVELRYLPTKCGGCTYAKSINGGENEPTHADGQALTADEKSAIYKLRK